MLAEDMGLRSGSKDRFTHGTAAAWISAYLCQVLLAQVTQILRGLLSALKGDIIAIILENKYACFLLQKETLSLFSKIVHFTNMFKSPKQKSVIVCLQDAQKQEDCVLAIFKIWCIIIAIHFLELKNFTFLG